MKTHNSVLNFLPLSLSFFSFFLSLSLCLCLRASHFSAITTKLFHFFILLIFQFSVIGSPLLLLIIFTFNPWSFRTPAPSSPSSQGTLSASISITRGAFLVY